MPTVSMRQLLEAGVHFGHQTRRWNPKMRPFIFAERNGIHIIDLAQTVKRLDAALDFVTETAARGEAILFVGTKKQAQEPVMQEAVRAGQPYVTKRWLGGMLTNFITIKKRIGLLDQLEARQQSGDFDRLPKKEAAMLTEELNKLQAMLGGIRKMKRAPGAVFIVDPHRERIAVTEANKLEIPVIGTGDTNVDPDELDYIIPANDDAIRAIRLLCQLVADATIEGAGQRAARATTEPEAPEPQAMGEPEFDEAAAADLVAQLQAGGTLSFDPDLDDDLLPGLPGSVDGDTDGSGVEAASLLESPGLGATPAVGGASGVVGTSGIGGPAPSAASAEASPAPARAGATPTVGLPPVPAVAATTTTPPRTAAARRPAGSPSAEPRPRRAPTTAASAAPGGSTPSAVTPRQRPSTTAAPAAPSTGASSAEPGTPTTGAPTAPPAPDPDAVADAGEG